MAPDIEYAAAYAVRTQTPGDQRVRDCGGAEPTEANDSPATSKSPGQSPPGREGFFMWRDPSLPPSLLSVLTQR
jgi:hypothetical protein